MYTYICIPQVISLFQKAKIYLVPENILCREDVSDEIFGETFYFVKKKSPEVSRLGATLPGLPMRIEIEGVCRCLQRLSTTCVSIFLPLSFTCLYRCSVVYFSSHFQEKAQGTCYFQREVGDGIESNYIRRLNV